MKVVVLLALVLVIGVLGISGQSQAGEECPVERAAAIKETALNYVEGWYTGDAARLEKALHPKLAKRWITVSEGGEASLIETTVEKLVEGAKRRKEQGKPLAEDQTIEVSILDVYKNMAAVRVNSPLFVDYVHLARWNGEWLITNVLWENRD